MLGAAIMGGTRRSQPYRRGPREPGMALRMMLQGRPGFQPNPQDLERQTMSRHRGGLGALLRSIPQGGGMAGQFGNGGGLGREGALRMQQARGIGRFNQPAHGQLGASGFSSPSDISRSIGPVNPSDASRQGFFNREQQLGQGAPRPIGAPGGEVRQIGVDPRALDQAQRSGDRFGAMYGAPAKGIPGELESVPRGLAFGYGRNDYRADFGRRHRLRHPWRSVSPGPF